MPVSVETVKSYIDNALIDRIIDHIDTKLSDPSWIKDWRCGEGTEQNPWFWRTYIPGYVNQNEKAEICRRYQEAGWKLEVLNSCEVGEHYGMIGVTLLMPAE